jgi:DNA/RNA-binding domain of Phe-tRNA-synthetase-like protein
MDVNLYDLKVIYNKIVWLLDVKTKYSYILCEYIQNTSDTDPMYENLVNANNKLNKLGLFLEEFKKHIQGKIESI